MIQETANIYRNRVNSLTPDKGLINVDLQLIMYMKSLANTSANRAIWGAHAQVVYLDSNVETLAIVERDKDKPAIVYSQSPYELTEIEAIELADICLKNDIEFSGNYSEDIQNLNNIGIAIIKLIDL